MKPQSELERLHADFPTSLALAELELEVTESLEIMTLEALAANRSTQAEMLLGVLGPRLFDAVVLEALEGSLDAVQVRLAETQRQRQLARLERDRMAELKVALDGASGSAEKTAQRMDRTLGGSFRRLLSAVEGVQIATVAADTATIR